MIEPALTAEQIEAMACWLMPLWDIAAAISERKAEEAQHADTAGPAH